MPSEPYYCLEVKSAPDPFRTQSANSFRWACKAAYLAHINLPGINIRMKHERLSIGQAKRLTRTSQKPLLSSKALYGFPLPPLAAFTPCGALVTASSSPSLGAFGSHPSLSIFPAHSAQRMGRSGETESTMATSRTNVEMRVSRIISVGRGCAGALELEIWACSRAE